MITIRRTRTGRFDLYLPDSNGIGRFAGQFDGFSSAADFAQRATGTRPGLESLSLS